MVMGLVLARCNFLLNMVLLEMDPRVEGAAASEMHKY